MLGIDARLCQCALIHGMCMRTLRTRVGCHDARVAGVALAGLWRLRLALRLRCAGASAERSLERLAGEHLMLSLDY